MAAFELPSATYAHVNLAFITIDPTTFEVVPIPAAHANAIQRFTQRKKYDPDLRVFVTVSGLAPHDWSKPDASVFSRLARSDAHQTVFLRSLTSFISTYDIDGVDINWEHPDGFSDDYENLPKLMQNIRSALLLTGGRYGLSMTLPVSLPNLHNYNLRRLPRYVDYFNLMPLDLHSQLQMGDTWQGQSLGPVVNMTQVEEAMDLLWRNHVMPDNVNFGIALYSASLVPADRECTHVGCPAISGATPGFSSLKQGMLMNSEVQDLMDPAFHERAHGRLYHRHDWGSRALQYSVLDADAGVRISQNKHQWIAYEDRETLEKKLESARDLGFGGVVVWAMSHDTYNADYTKVLDCLLEEKFHRRKSLQYHYCNEIQLHQV
ncbi:hypothetical protein ARAM_003367 [Aspergillus rambellii]|uniref:chitinase n=1 Tax=Aspergillus rambellii TaxID=308745 RepID=A0A0F8W445_9EURO|nr:hypothetical protein ARAM_003367 [Aspergillus rambellii]